MKELMVICKPAVIATVILNQLQHKNAKVGNNLIACHNISLPYSNEIFLAVYLLPHITNIAIHLLYRMMKMREDCINVIIFALLTFPSTEFNLEDLVATIGPHVTDSKRRVRQASMECLALLSQCLGPGKVI